MSKIFINLTAHPLTQEQMRAAAAENWRIIEAADFLTSETLGELRQSPDNVYDLSRLAYKLIAEIDAQFPSPSHRLFLHLPAGSPAFMAILASRVAQWARYKMVFSHSRRESVEETQPDGTVLKKAVFRFEKFIII